MAALPSTVALWRGGRISSFSHPDAAMETMGNNARSWPEGQAPDPCGRGNQNPEPLIRKLIKQLTLSRAS
jgi:hypothetical protein